MDDPAGIETTVEPSVHSAGSAKGRLARVEHFAWRPGASGHTADCCIDTEQIEANTQHRLRVHALAACFAACMACLCVMRIDALHMDNSTFWAIDSILEAVGLCSIVALTGGFMGFSSFLCAHDLFKWLTEVEQEVTYDE